MPSLSSPHAGDIVVAYADRSTGVAIVVPLVVGAVGLAIAVVRYRRAEID